MADAGGCQRGTRARGFTLGSERLLIEMWWLQRPRSSARRRGRVLETMRPQNANAKTVLWDYS